MFTLDRIRLWSFHTLTVVHVGGAGGEEGWGGGGESPVRESCGTASCWSSEALLWAKPGSKLPGGSSSAPDLMAHVAEKAFLLLPVGT